MYVRAWKICMCYVLHVYRSDYARMQIVDTHLSDACTHSQISAHSWRFFHTFRNCDYAHARTDDSVTHTQHTFVDSSAAIMAPIVDQ